MLFFRLICAVTVLACAVWWLNNSGNPHAEPVLAVVAAAVVMLEIVVESVVFTSTNKAIDDRSLHTNSGEQLDQVSDKAEALRLISCQYCDATGRILESYDRFNTVYATCGICNGHGEIKSELWNQPDCRRCNGSGKLITQTTQKIGRRRHSTKFTQPCNVCGGIGKRPMT